MAIRLTHILYFLLLIYPTSLLGGYVLYGNIGTNSYIFFSLYIIFFSIYELIKFKSLKINYDYLLIFSFLFLIFKINYSYNTTYLRELLLLTTTYLYFQNNAQSKILNIFYVFLFFSISSLILYMISFLIPLDLITVDISKHKALFARADISVNTIYYNYGNLLLNRSDGVNDFIRYSAHFLEPGFLWFFGLLFYQIKEFRFVQACTLLLGIAYYGVITIILSIIYYFKSFRSLILLFLLILVSIYLFNDIILTKVLQFEFMFDKGFFLIPEISLFGSSDSIELQFVGLGIILISFKYGLIGLLFYLLWMKKVFFLKNKMEEKSQVIVLIALLIYFFKMPFFISHLYFAYIISKESIKMNYHLSNN
jgi:hypothetical protein